VFTNGLNTVQTVSAAASRFERFVLQSDTEETLWASVCIEGLNVRFRRQGRAGGPLIHLMRFESTYLVTLPASPCHDAPPGFLIYVIIYRYYVGTGETGRDGEIDREGEEMVLRFKVCILSPTPHSCSVGARRRVGLMR